MTDYSFAPCDDSATWDALVDDSPQGSVFCRSALLEGLVDVERDLWLVLRNGNVEAGAVVLRRPGSARGNGYHLLPYQGVLHAGHISRSPVHRRARWITEVLGLMLDELCARYESLRLCLHPAFEDLRPLQWHNYHDDAAPAPCAGSSRECRHRDGGGGGE